jgi:hypothetical protein
MKRSPLRKVSKKRAVEMRKYLKLREKFLTVQPWCEVGATWQCTTKATDVHHMRGRGKYLCDWSYFMAVCRFCHQYVHDNPYWARKHKYILSK